MVFSKSFPRTLGKGTVWEEISLTEAEEREMDQKARLVNIHLFKECYDDAVKILKEKQLKDYQSDAVNIATSLFEKRAAHVVYFKENLCKEKFDIKYNSSGDEKK